MRRGIRSVIALSVALASTTQATWAESNTFTLEDCLREAASRSAELMAAKESVNVAEAQLKASYSGFLPQLSANLGYQRSNSLSTTSTLGSATSAATSDDARNNYSAGVTASQSLFSGFRDTAKVAEARLNLMIAEAQLATTKAKLAYDIKDNFSAMAAAQEQVAVADSIVKRRAANVRLVELRFEAGRENKGAYLLSRADLHESEIDARQARRSIETARRQLARLLGKTGDEVFRVAGNLKVASMPKAAMTQFDSLAQSTPDYRQSRAQLELADAQVREARADLMPELSLSGSYSKVGENFFPDQNRWSVGLNLSYAFFPGGRTYFAMNAANALERKARATHDDTLAQISIKLQQAYASFETAAERMTVADEYLDAARVREDIARAKYASGLLDFEEWDRIENELFSREQDAVQKRRDAVVNEARWIQVQGKGEIP